MDLGGDCCKQESVGGNRKLEIYDFSLLSSGSLPLAKLLLGKKETFLPPAEVVKWYRHTSEILRVWLETTTIK